MYATNKCYDPNLQKENVLLDYKMRVVCICVCPVITSLPNAPLMLPGGLPFAKHIFKGWDQGVTRGKGRLGAKGKMIWSPQGLGKGQGEKVHCPVGALS